MKFGKHLKEHRVAEWQEKYIDYSALKKLITGVGKSRSASLMELQPANVGSPPSPTCAISPPTLSEQLHTFPIINSPSSSSLNRSGRGMRFGRKTQQPRTSAQPPSSPPTTFGEFLNSSASSSEKMFFVYLDAQVEQADSFLVGNCDQAQVRFRALKDQSIVYLARKRDHEGQRNRGKNLQYEFAAAIESDLKKIKNKIGGTLRHMIPASKQPSGVSSEIEMKPMESTATTAATATAKGKSTAIADSEDSLGSQPILAADQEVGLSTEILVQTSKHLRDAKLVIKSAMLEFYRYLELLKNYKILNSTAIVKTLKKYDKISKTKVSSLYMEKIKNNCLISSTVIDTLLQDVENLFVDFMNTTRHRAMQALRLPDEQITHYFTTWRSGLFLGLALPAIANSIQLVATGKTTIEQPLTILQIYAGLAIPIIFLFLFSANLIIWTKYRVNYTFIFEFDPRDHLSPSQFTEIGAFLFIMLAYVLYFHVSGVIPSSHPLSYVVFLVVFYITLMINPIPIFYKSARMWMVRTISRIILSGVFAVEFRDFFLTDLLCSMTYFFVSLELMVCSSIVSFENLDNGCAASTSYYVALAASLPSYWRLAQCIRRWRDSGNAHPHITNAVKYILSLCVIWLSNASRITGSETIMAVWLLFAAITTCYAQWWDVWFDWGLLRKNGKHRFLREILVYPWKNGYYIAMGINFILRLSWVFLISPNQWFVDFKGQILTFILALLELFRRFVWNFLRMENEMSNNIGDFRAVREIPLPFTLPNEQLDFESENDSESIYSVSKKKEREVEFEKVADEDNSSTRSSVAGTGGSGDDLMLSLRNRSLSSPSAMMKSP